MTRGLRDHVGVKAGDRHGVPLGEGSSGSGTARDWGWTRALLLLAIASTALLAQAAPAAAATFTVTTTADSGAGSLRQAIFDSNATGTGNTIAFAIPGPGPHVIAPASALPAIGQDDTTVDGCTQPGADCSDLPLTLQVRLEGQGLSTGSYGVTIRGLSFTGPGTAITAIRVARGGQFVLPDDLTVERNYIGLAPDGSAAGKNLSIQLQPGLRNVNSAYDDLRIVDNVIGANATTAIGATAQAFSAGRPITGARISGNIVGLDPTGTEPRPNGGDGIAVDVSGDTQIVGNVVANNAGVGIRHRGRNQVVPGSDPAVDPGLLIQDNVVEGNAGGGISIAPDDPILAPPSADPYSGPVRIFGNTVRDNGVAGISVIDAADTIRPNLRIGGTAPGEPNTITGNDGPGVAVGDAPDDTSVAVTVRGNSIFANAGPGIDLASDGPTENAPAGTTRTGPNSLLNHPLITELAHGSLIVEGTYEGAPDSAYTLDFYKSETADGPQTWVGSTSVTTDATGAAAYSAEFEPSVPEGWFIHATATDAEGSTSEFGEAAQVPPVPPPPPTPPAPPAPSTPVPAHDLSIAETVSPGSVTVGDAVTYRLVVANHGPDAADGVRVTDSLPDRLDARSARATKGTCSLRGNAVSCQLGTLTAGRPVTVTIRAVAVRAGRARDSAEVAAPPGGSDDPANNTSAVTLRIVKPTLRLAHEVDRTTLRADGTATYTIRVRNPSRGVLRRVRTCDRLPAGMVRVSATRGARLSNGRYCWTARRLAAGASRTYRLTVRALRGADGRRISRATASSPDARTARASRALRVIGDDVAAGGGVTG
jgi:uncharacterized repeat protein (TIGR01451 family)